MTTTEIPTLRNAHDFAELSTIDAAAPPATAPHLIGDHTGRILAVAGMDRLPRLVRRAGTTVIAVLARPLWRGKRFRSDGTGSNLWLRMNQPAEWGHFTHTPDQLDYHVTNNPKPVRFITGQVTELAPGLLLGKMQLGRSKTTLMYFTLER